MTVQGEDYFAAFAKVSKAISASLDLQEVLGLILDQAVASLDLKAGALSLLNKKENRLELICHRNLSEEFIHKGPILADKSVPRALEKKAPVIVTDIDADKQLQYPEACKREGFQFILSVPILFKNEVMGLLRLYDARRRDFSERDLMFITALAEQGGIAIQNARYMGKIVADHKKEMESLWDWFNSMTGTLRLDG